MSLVTCHFRNHFLRVNKLSWIILGISLTQFLRIVLMRTWNKTYDPLSMFYLARTRGHMEPGATMLVSELLFVRPGSSIHDTLSRPRTLPRISLFLELALVPKKSPDFSAKK